MLSMCPTPALLLAGCLVSGAQCAQAATYEFRQQLASNRAKAPSALRTPVAAPACGGRSRSREPPVVQPPPLPSWIRFDGSLLALSGRTPLGSPMTVTVQVLARNTRGLTASATLELVVR